MTKLRQSLISLARHSDTLLQLKNHLGMRSWKRAGKPVPPPHYVKESIVSTYAEAFGVKTLVETGTYLGDMIYAVRDHFLTIISIELSADLWKRATSRFRGDSNIEIRQGDSGEVLPQVLKGISGSCVFWLDGHYSAGITAKGGSETPVMQEVITIFEHANTDHVILIDDARCFDGTHDYPTLEQLRALVAAHRPDYAFTVSNDVIRIHPQKNVQCEF